MLLGDPKEIFLFNGTRVAPKDIKGYVPLMEWVPGTCFYAKSESDQNNSKEPKS